MPEKFTMKACAEFYCHQIAEKFSLKFPLSITNLDRVDTDQFVFFGPSSECQVPLFNELIKLLLANLLGGGPAKNFSLKFHTTQE